MQSRTFPAILLRQSLELTPLRKEDPSRLRPTLVRNRVIVTCRIACTSAKSPSKLSVPRVCMHDDNGRRVSRPLSYRTSPPVEKNRVPGSPADFGRTTVQDRSSEDSAQAVVPRWPAGSCSATRVPPSVKWTACRTLTANAPAISGLQAVEGALCAGMVCSPPLAIRIGTSKNRASWC